MNRRDKEIEIFKAATKSIGKYGVERANAQTIAEELGISQSGIFYYFPKQEDLFDSLVAYIAEVNHQLVSDLLESKQPVRVLDRLFLHLEGNLKWAAKHPDHVAVLLVSIAKTQRSKTMRERVNRLLQTGEDRIYGYLAAGVAEKEFAFEGSVRSMAVFIHKLLIGVIVSFYHSRGSERDLAFFLHTLKVPLQRVLDKVH